MSRMPPQKHVIDTVATSTTGALVIEEISHGVNNPNYLTDLTYVKNGSVIASIDILLTWVREGNAPADTATTPWGVDFYIGWQRTNQVMPDPNSVGQYPIMNQIFHQDSGYMQAAIGAGNALGAMPVSWHFRLKIPKAYQQQGLGDRLVLVWRANKTDLVTKKFRFIYKEYFP